MFVRAAGINARNEDGKLKAYLEEERLAVPYLIAFQETWAAWDTRKRGDLRQLLYKPRHRGPASASADDQSSNDRKRDSLGLDDSQDDAQVRSPKLTVAFSQSSYILMTYRVVGTSAR